MISDEQESPAHARPSLARAVRVSILWLTLWLTPTMILGAVRGWDSTLFKQGLFFSKAAVVTFGGAYAVLPYVAQQALFHYGWLKPGQMMDGLGLAETTPGPLIMVLQFVGFMGAWQHPEGLPPLLAATIGALITTWATFTPCFLWIFLGAPYIEQLRGNTRLTSALLGDHCRDCRRRAQPCGLVRRSMFSFPQPARSIGSQSCFALPRSSR